MRSALGAGWFGSERRHAALLIGFPLLACGAGLLVLADRRLLLPVLLFDLVLMGCHHVAAVWRRVQSSRIETRAERFALVELPLVVIACAALLAWGAAPWLPVTAYLYWHWFYYARQSWRVGERFRSQADKSADTGDRSLLTAAFYLVPAWGILYRSIEAPPSFIGLELHVLPISAALADGIGIAACGALILWLVERAIAWSEGRLPLAHTLYLISHFAVFLVAYRIIDDVTIGWLVATLWHNTQHIGLERLTSQRRGARRKSLDAAALGGLALAALVAASAAAAQFLGAGMPAVLLPGVAIFYLTVHWHRYAMDAVERPTAKPQQILIPHD